ncbi:MAG: CmcI family methyltransferase [candidate division WOR-3 bacterium]
MTDKRMLTKEEFENLRKESAARMAADKALQKDALDVLVRADKHMWIHQTSWFGEPILNLPQDMFAIQEIIYRTRPRFIIESGVAWGGSLLFYATLMEALGGEKIIGIDIYMPDDLLARLRAVGRLSKRLVFINGSSTDASTLQKVRDIVGDSRQNLVILDSFHTHDHVLQELRGFSPLVGKGSYIVVGDTIVEEIPVQEHRPRPWGPGHNPMTAVRQFLTENSRFEADRSMDDKLLFTCNPGGYLRCVGD